MQYQSQARVDIMIARNNLVSLLNHREVWQATINNASGMDCLKNGTDCSTATPGNFDLYDIDDPLTPLYAPTSATNVGLSKTGESCSTFVATGSPGQRDCPMRLTLSWAPVCPSSGSCIAPNVRIQGSFEVNSPEFLSEVKTDSLNFVIFK